ncbi:MAG: response regulator transcription factor [Anaerolineales bacterium]|nr:response regulator transcription factor [Anaerolineales bacterium]
MRVVVVDDHSLFRDGITSLLEAAGHEVVQQCSDGLAAVQTVRQLQPDLVLMDISMPRMDGLAALKTIKEEYPQILVVILTVSDRDEDLFNAIRSGADGYLLKDLNASEFLAMLAGLSGGEAAITRKTAARLMSGFQNLAQPPEETPYQLTEREMQMLRWMGQGYSNKAIAEQLFISENTVKYHIRNILQKLNVQNRTEAVALALREGLLDLNSDQIAG